MSRSELFSAFLPKAFAALCLCLCPALWAEIRLDNADDAVSVALANDFEGAIKRKIAEEEVRLAKKSLTAFMPEFDFSLSDSAYAKPSSGDYKKKSMEIGVTQKLFNGGKSVLEYKMQREKSVYNFWQTVKEEEEAKNKVVQAYHEALLAKLKAEVLKDALENAREILLVAELEEEEGMISPMELMESQIRFKEMNAKAKSARSLFLDLTRALAILMNVSPNEKILFAQGCEDFLAQEPPESQSLLDRVPEFCQSAAENSVDLKKAKAECEWTKKKRALLVRSFLPSVSVRAGISASGRDYPLTGPSYSFKVILGFDSNPWLPMTAARSAGVEDGKLVSIADTVTGKGIINTSWTSQARLGKIGVEKSRIDAEKVQTEIESRVFRLVQKIEEARENALLNLDTARLRERKLVLSKIQLEQGEIKMTDYLKELSECAEEKINCAKSFVDFAALKKELEDFASCKI